MVRRKTSGLSDLALAASATRSCVKSRVSTLCGEHPVSEASSVVIVMSVTGSGAFVFPEVRNSCWREWPCAAFWKCFLLASNNELPEPTCPRKHAASPGLGARWV
ncbi:hypothetical protein AK812_SmicGene654 [Symbiodinium microadriaticum]|uniref:Uncharacterized protein n=1 Tax=Symbiodinium microadriaticum TaxID=2951 RepID=A0A1Q9F5W1_SYMMI|nr:hypothetical protein AK812_SmicGene654 [Symbiodinium microadriaticum]